MELKKLVIHGFKSFADRVELTFEHGITGVVGPNGCGKSNISDAVRWVLGEQSAKSLRGAKMEDVIFNGTEKRRKQAFCEVTLVFDNTDHALPIDFAEVAVSRRVYRNGDGEYQINGAPCRLKDIVDLFRDTGLGRDGYSIVGQGRIDEILSAKSEDRRQVFEEAAGIMKYKARKNESQRKLESSQTNLERVQDILGELEERVEPLKKQSEEAREYLALRDELKTLDLNVFLTRSVKYRSPHRRTASGPFRRGKESGGSLRAIGSPGRKAHDQQMELDRLEMDSAEKREEVQTLIRQVESLDGEVGVLHERIGSLKREHDRLLRRAGTGRRRRRRHPRSGRRDEIGAGGRKSSPDRRRKRPDPTGGRTQAGAEKSLSEMEAAAEAAKGEIIRIMNRLSDVRSQQARLSAMKAALEQQISGMDQTSLRDQEGLDALESARPGGPGSAGRGKAAADGIEGAHGIHGEIRAGGRRGRQAPGNRIYPGPWISASSAPPA